MLLALTEFYKKNFMWVNFVCYMSLKAIEYFFLTNDPTRGE